MLRHQCTPYDDSRGLTVDARMGRMRDKPVGPIDKRYSTALRDARADLIAHAAGDGGAIEFRTGPTADDLRVAAGDRLARLPFPARAFRPAADGVLTIAGTVKGIATAAGTAGHLRLVDGSGACVLAGAISAPGDGGPLELARLDVAVDDPIVLEQFTLVAANE